MALRTCAVCRQRAPMASLLRLVRVGGVAVPDDAGKRSGRGAWIHPACTADLNRRPGVFSRALRAETRAGAELASEMRAALEREVSRLHTAARRLGLADDEGRVQRSRRTATLVRKMGLLRDLG